jgi:hypothetical protein
MIKCPGCGADVHALLTQCPKCGANLRMRPRAVPHGAMPGGQSKKSRPRVSVSPEMVSLGWKLLPLVVFLVVWGIYYLATNSVRSELKRVQTNFRETGGEFHTFTGRLVVSGFPMAKVQMPWFAFSMPAEVEVSGSGPVDSSVVNLYQSKKKLVDLRLKGKYYPPTRRLEVQVEGNAPGLDFAETYERDVPPPGG